MTRRPRIGLTTWLKHLDDPHETSPHKHTIDRNYADAVYEVGGLPLLLPSIVESAAIAELLDTLDGVVVTGGGDLCPVVYGARNDGDSRGIDDERDAFEIELVRQAQARGLPLLGICRGIQVIAVAFGGRLHQHVTGADHHDHPSVADRPGQELLARRHSVDIAADSRLAAVYGTGELVVNSLHHQSVADPGDGLRVVAQAGDGIIEAIESTRDDLLLLAVQWHPEKMRAEGGDELIGWFVQAVLDRLAAAS